MFGGWVGRFWGWEPLDEGDKGQFQLRLAEESRRHARFFCPVSILMFSSYIAWDYLVDPAMASAVLPVRLGWPLLPAFVWAISDTHFFLRHHQMIIASLIATAGIAVSIIILAMPSVFAVGIGGLLVVIMYSAGAFRLGIAHAAGAYAVILLSANVAMAQLDLSPVIIAANNWHLTSGCIIGMLYSTMGELWFRRMFLLDRTLEKERERSASLAAAAETARSQRLTWLESIASFLRHELRNQFIGARTSLELYRQQRAEPDAIRYIDRAERSLDVMRQLIHSASEATTIEAALNLNDREVIDLSAIAEERVESFRAIHPGQPIEFDSQDDARIVGSDARIVQLLDKVLDNAVDHGSASEPVLVRVGIDRTVVFVEVENVGVINGDPQVLFQPFVTTRPGVAGVHQGLGLFVARCIAEFHHGTIDACESGHGRVVIRTEFPRIQGSDVRSVG